MSIPGPYEYGNTPPAHLANDWPIEELGGMDAIRREFDRLAASFSPFAQLFATASPDKPDRKPIWEYMKAGRGGQHLPAFYQLDGDCVAQGARHGVAYRHAWEVRGNFEEERLRLPFGPWIYGTSRADVGGNRLRGAGSLGSWAAKAMMEFGILFEDDPGVPAYSLAVSRAWGQGPPKEFYPVAKDNRIGRAAELKSVEQVRAALWDPSGPRCVTIASTQGWAMQPVEYKGYHCFKPSGSFAHQTVLLDWMDDPFPAAYRLNTWGPNAHGTPLNGEPPGGAWWRVEDLEREIKSRDVELYALELFSGDPSKPDHRLVRPTV